MIQSSFNSAKIAEFLLQIKAIKLQPKEPFTWASGWKSPIYCDNRKILSHPEIRSAVRDEFVKAIKANSVLPTAIAGVATGGIAIGALVAESLKLPFCYVRSSAKAHGLNNQIEGGLNTNEKVLVIEDLISSGKSSLAAVNALTENNYNVIGLGAIFSYGFEKAGENFRMANCPYFTLTNYASLINIAANKSYIDSDEIDTLNNWRKSPETWS